MMTRFLASALLLLGAGAGTSESGDEGPVIRISVDLVQLDVVVTDSKGRHVTDLGAEDFLVVEGGRTHRVTHASYVRAGETWADAATRRGERGAHRSAPVAPPRTVALFYDDLGMGFRSSVDARSALREVVEGLDPTDRVAVVSPATWDGVLRLTSDADELRQAVSELRFQFSSRRRVYVPRTDERGSLTGEGGFLADAGEVEWDRRLRISALVALKQLIKELGEVEGRKAVVVLSEGFAGLGQLSNRFFGRVDLALDTAFGGAADVQQALYRLGDFAARSSVVIYAIDPRGLVTFGPTADSGSRSPPPDSHLFEAVAFRGSQASLEHLPSLTGGLAIVGTNDLVGAAERILDDMSGYYLVGFTPSAETFRGERPRFNDVAVAVRRKGVRIRTRRGFFGIADEDLAVP